MGRSGNVVVWGMLLLYGYSVPSAVCFEIAVQCIPCLLRSVV